MSNWIVQQFEALKERLEAHIPATNNALNNLEARVQGTESYTLKSVEALQARVAALEAGTVKGSCAQPDRAPL